jgi:hypothetical protein
MPGTYLGVGYRADPTKGVFHPYTLIDTIEIAHRPCLLYSDEEKKEGYKFLFAGWRRLELFIESSLPTGESSTTKAVRFDEGEVHQDKFEIPQSYTKK